MDILRLAGMQFHARHGYYNEEKETGNRFEVDIEFGLDLEPAAHSDSISATVDYTRIHAVVAEVMNGPSLNLIEALCHRIGERLFATFRPDRLLVTVRKLNPPMDGETHYSEVCLQWPR